MSDVSPSLESEGPLDGKNGAVDLQWRVDDRFKYPPDAELQKWAYAAFVGKVDEAQTQVTICIVDSAEMQLANSSWRGKDKTTNVLSFPADIPAETGLQYLGDILVCANVLEAEYAEQQKPQSAHWAHIVIHGVLHLQGYDHVVETDAEEMEQVEIEILARLGFPNPYVSRHGTTSITEVDQN